MIGEWKTARLESKLSDRLSRLYAHGNRLSDPRMETARSINLNFEKGNCGDVLRQQGFTYICGDEDDLIR